MNHPKRIILPSEHAIGRALPNGCAVGFDVADATKMPLDDGSVDLVFGSPPYLAARTYGIGAQRGMRAWLDFMLAATAEGLRVSRGLVLWVIAGTTEDKVYQPGPEALMYEAWSAGMELWRPACWWKVDDATEGGCGQPGSGGKQWLRSDWEYVLAFKRPGPLPFADPLFEKRAPKFAPGGKIRPRHRDGGRAPRAFKQPGFTNPGNVVKTTADDAAAAIAAVGEARSAMVKARVGGGHQGDAECHDNEAPFPEKLAEFFVCGWCPPGGWVYDPFNGSGTTAITAGYHGRNGYGTDLRPGQVQLSTRRLDRRIAEGRAVA